jgi:hypothetical protein
LPASQKQENLGKLIDKKNLFGTKTTAVLGCGTFFKFGGPGSGKKRF